MRSRYIYRVIDTQDNDRVVRSTPAYRNALLWAWGMNESSGAIRYTVRVAFAETKQKQKRAAQ